MATHSSILTWRIPWTIPWDLKELDLTKSLSLSALWPGTIIPIWVSSFCNPGLGPFRSTRPIGQVKWPRNIELCGSHPYKNMGAKVSSEFKAVYQFFPGGASGKEPANAWDLRDAGSIPGLGRSPGAGHGNLFQYSCLENSSGQRSLAGCKESDMTEAT